MSLYLSALHVHVPPPRPCGGAILDADYLNVAATFGAGPGTMPFTAVVPRADDAESVALASLRPTLADADAPPELLFDCRSMPATGLPAPTYRLLHRAGLARVLPFHLSGQGGAEVGQALWHLWLMSRRRPVRAVISASQHVLPPLEGEVIPDCGFPSGDASAALLVSSEPLGRAAFCVSGIAVAHREGDPTAAAVVALERLKHPTSWAVAHHVSHAFSASLHALLPRAHWLERSSFPEVNLGCACPLVSIHEVQASERIGVGRAGCVCFVGRWGAVAVAQLQSAS